MAHWLHKYRDFGPIEERVSTPSCTQQRNSDCGAYAMLFAEGLANTLPKDKIDYYQKCIGAYRAYVAVRIVRHQYSNHSRLVASEDDIVQHTTM